MQLKNRTFHKYLQGLGVVDVYENLIEIYNSRKVLSRSSGSLRRYYLNKNWKIEKNNSNLVRVKSNVQTDTRLA